MKSLLITLASAHAGWALGTAMRGEDGRQYHCRSCLNAYSKVRKAAIKDGSWLVR